MTAIDRRTALIAALGFPAVAGVISSGAGTQELAERHRSEGYPPRTTKNVAASIYVSPNGDGTDLERINAAIASAIANGISTVVLPPKVADDPTVPWTTDGTI